MAHKLVNGALFRDRERGGITAQCECGWTSTHFTSLSASAAFQDHQEREQSRERQRED